MHFRKAFLAAAVAGSLLAVPATAQNQSAARPAAAVTPNLNGIWQAFTTANWNIQDHAAYAGPMWEVGAIGAAPAGQGVVEGNEIPYKPEAAAQQKKNFRERRTLDPEAKCYMPGVPRANYMPYPFQILETGKDILLVYEYATSSRLVNMGKPIEASTDTWMGNSNGHWEGKTLVVDVTGLNGLAWFDRAGNFASDKLHVVERYTLIDKDHINYEATIADPTVFTRPWKISYTLYRRVEKSAQLLEFKCVEFAEELLYGKYKKQPDN